MLHLPSFKPKYESAALTFGLHLLVAAGILGILGVCLAGCSSVMPPPPTPIRIAQFSASTFCRQMTVLDHLGQKQCRASYAKEDTPLTANTIEDICARWAAAGCAGKGK